MAHERGAPGGRVGTGPGDTGGEASGPPVLRVLGGFELRVDAEAVPLPANGRRVLACLALTGPGMRRDVLAGRVWAWSSQARAQANLRNALWRIRRADRRVVQADKDEVRLGGDVAVDLRASTRLARELIDRPEA